jgi:hypothetical protein
MMFPITRATTSSIFSRIQPDRNLDRTDATVKIPNEIPRALVSLDTNSM